MFGTHESGLEDGLLLHDLSDAVQVNSLADSDPNAGPDEPEEKQGTNDGSDSLLGTIEISLLIQPVCEVLEVIMVFLGEAFVVLSSF